MTSSETWLIKKPSPKVPFSPFLISGPIGFAFFTQLSFHLRLRWFYQTYAEIASKWPLSELTTGRFGYRASRTVFTGRVCSWLVLIYHSLQKDVFKLYPDDFSWSRTLSTFRLFLVTTISLGTSKLVRVGNMAFRTVFFLTSFALGTRCGFFDWGWHFRQQYIMTTFLLTVLSHCYLGLLFLVSAVKDGIANYHSLQHWV